MVAKSISYREALEIYETRLCPVRTLFEQESTLVTQILTPHIEPDVLELFLIYFCGLGVAMTEPVEGWIRRAGVACQEMGLNELGKSLYTHASHEANHHLMLIEDTRSLVDRWNERHQAPVNADEILAHPVTEGVLCYRELHEKVIADGRPFCQIAIEYEIEKMSAEYGPRWLDQIARVLGPETLATQTFVLEHVELDVGHTKFNQFQLGKLLAIHPEYAEDLADTGAAALRAYDSFLDDCLNLARMRLSAGRTLVPRA
ncbi:MAG: hypothetical protein MOB07_28905 [Acidobacteria bacterium]|nr:hypothetical protein [Acidobacteriota bacterium]